MGRSYPWGNAMMSTLIFHLRQDLGLRYGSGFYRDRLFVLAILAGFAVVGVLYMVLPGYSLSSGPTGLATVVKWLIWAPILEELLFRGVLQGELQQRFNPVSHLLGLSYANWITSLIFAGIHFLHHPPLWAGAVLFPSLVFGFFRDRNNSVFPAIVLHAVYNAQMLILLG